MSRYSYYLMNDGRAGSLKSIEMDGSLYMQFGSDGPFEYVSPDEVQRKLTEDEFWKIRG